MITAFFFVFFFVFLTKVYYNVYIVVNHVKSGRVDLQCREIGMGCYHPRSHSSEKSSLVTSCEPPSQDDARNTEQETRRDAQLHYYSGGAQDTHSLDSSRNAKGGNGYKPTNYSGPIKKNVVEDEKEEEEEGRRMLGLEESDSGVHSRSSVNSPKRGTFSFGGKSKIKTNRGKDLHNAIKQAYKLKDRFREPTNEFLREMDKLFMDVQIYLTELSALATSNHKEADALVDELIALRNHWGSTLLPLNVCNAFVRERIQLTTASGVHYRIDCAQFFEPVPFYSSSASNASELMKLFRFSVYDMSRNEVVLRYYLERSNIVQMYHVLCYSHGSDRGQVHPFGVECPTYWTVRQQMVNDACRRLDDF